MIEKFNKDREERIKKRYNQVPQDLKDASFVNQDNTAPERNNYKISSKTSHSKIQPTEGKCRIIFRKLCRCWCITKSTEQIIPSEATESRVESV
jgi:type II secretory pathway component PulJ